MDSPPVDLLFRIAVVGSLLASAAVAIRLGRPPGIGRRLRERFVLGLPWGTLVSAGIVAGVYLLVQGGLRNWYAPVTVAFRAWSYFYPLGMVTAAFAHGGPGHLIGNLVGTLTLAPIAEYAWGHFPRRRGTQTFSSLRTNPYVRGFVAFPAAVLVVGLVSSVFAVGPVIGFSGVVFAFAGVALVNYPLATVIALLGGDALRLVYRALRSPTLTASGRPTYVSPWWADIAIQGHALGLLIGVLVGLWLLRRGRRRRPDARRLWLGAVLLGVEQSLWAVYWFRGGGTFVLYRAGGVALVAGLAVLVTLAAVTSDDPLFEWELAGDTGVVRNWQVAAGVLLLATAAVAGAAVPANLFTADSGDLPGDERVVRDYEVTYAEDVRNGMVAVVDVEAFGETTAVNTSGVVVRSNERGIWTTAVSKGRLAFDGRVPVRVGGVGWRETVYAQRDGWTVLGGGTAYRVGLDAGADDTRQVVYVSDSVTAGPTLDGRSVTLEPTTETYRVRVARDNGSVTRSAPLPAENESVTVDGLRFVRNASTVTVSYDRTQLELMARETYE